jgi:putative MATE family efflux protein
VAKTLDMTQGRPAPLIIKFAIPLIIANVFQQVYNLVDSIIVGRWVGANAFSAVGATSALTSMFTAMCWGATVGFGVIVSQYYGAKDDKNISAAIVNGFYVCFIVAVFMTIIALVFTRPLLRLLNTPEILMQDAVTYMHVILAGLIAVTVYHAGFSALQALGDSKTSLFFMIIANVLNVGLDLLFVIPFGMGVFGAALATILSQLIAAVFCIAYAFKTMPYFKKALHYLKPNKHLIKQVFIIGIPSGCQYSLIFLSGSVLQRVINGFGESIIGAFTATSRIEMLVEQPFYSLGSAIVTYTGQNIGAGRLDRVRQGMRSAVWMSAFYSVFLLAVFWITGNAVMSVFVKDHDIVSFATRGIRITSILFMAMGMRIILRNLLNGTGDSLYSLVNGIVEIGGKVGLALILTSIPPIGVWGIWVTTGLTWLIACLFALWRYKSGIWTRKTLIQINGDQEKNLPKRILGYPVPACPAADKQMHNSTL